MLEHGDGENLLGYLQERKGMKRLGLGFKELLGRRENWEKKERRREVEGDSVASLGTERIRRMINYWQ